VKSHPRCDELCFVQIHRAVHAFLQAFGHRLLHLLRLGCVLLQTSESCLPLRQFGIGQRDILDYGIPLVFILQLGSMPLYPRCT
jgi:hypothetical protein